MIQGDVEYCKIWQNNARMFGIEKMNNLSTFVNICSARCDVSVVSDVSDVSGTGLPAQCQRCRALEVLEHDKLQSPTLSEPNFAPFNSKRHQTKRICII